ncbi:MAG: ComEC family competence protein, partial [Bacteroidales bacterium]|nr:ComEC family competence protein [Bacteroidales bacterium]
MHNTPRYSLDHVPFLRLLIPLVVGISWQYIAPSATILYICIVIAIASGVVTWLLRKYTFSTTRKAMFALHIFAFFMAIGYALGSNSTPREELPATTPHTIAIARIEKIPSSQEYTYSTQATIVALNDSNHNQHTDIKIQLYLQKSFTAQSLRGGDMIIFHPELQPIESKQLPYTFDYAQFMARKGILYRQYLSDTDWQLSQQQAPLTLQHRAMKVQQQCIEVLHRCNLSAENGALLSALLWGYKADLQPSIKQYFSLAGLSHILAVSGLHTGIIALILWVILYPLRYTPLRSLRGIITLALLWVYAFVTGASPSVVRACIMASFVGIAGMLNRPNTSLNALCGSAVMVLLFAPMQLFDISFQLSYTAVAGIIVLSPHLNISNYLKSRNTILRYITGIIAASMAAQIATIPLASYYFHYIPVWGLLSNVLLTPLLTPLILMALGMQLLEALQLPHAWLDYATDFTCNLLCDGAQAIASFPGATIEGVWLSLPMLLLYSIVVGATWYAISRRTFAPITLALTAIVAMQCVVLYDTLRPSQPMALLPTER